MPIWTDAQLNQWGIDAEQQINQDLPVIYWRFYLPTIAGQSVYTLPSYVRTVSRISWLSRKLDPVNWEELTFLSPPTAFVNPNSPSFNIETSQGRPLYYAMHPTNPYDIRLYPTPNISLLANGPDPYSTTPNEPYCVVSCWRAIDSTLQDPKALLPYYIDRRMRKAYILWRAFASEGPGQNLSIAKYYMQKYQFLVSQFTAINNYCYLSKKYAVDDGSRNTAEYRYPRPTLNPNFERTIF